MKKPILIISAIILFISCSKDYEIPNPTDLNISEASFNNSNILFTIEAIKGVNLDGINFSFDVSFFAVSQPVALNTKTIKVFANAIMEDGSTREIDGLYNGETGFVPLEQDIDNFERKNLTFSISSNLIDGTIKTLETVSIKVTNTDNTSTIATSDIL
ncbi:MAG: hypothetical protein V3U92_02110 [Cellulophaga sp.]